MKQLFENWNKFLNEIGPSPEHQKTLDRAQRGYDKAFDAAEADRTPEEIRDDEVQDLAGKFNVDAFVEIASDGRAAIIVKHQDGKVSMYNDTEEMYKDLADEIGQDVYGSPDDDDWGLNEEDKDWIQKAVDPDHEGYCTPMTKSTCTPKRKALAKRFKKAAKKKEKKGGTGWQGKV